MRRTERIHLENCVLAKVFGDSVIVMPGTEDSETVPVKIRLPKVKRRRRYDPAFPDYMESDQDFVDNNLRACVWFLENRDKIAEVMKKAEGIKMAYACMIAKEVKAEFDAKEGAR